MPGSGKPNLGAHSSFVSEVHQQASSVWHATGRPPPRLFFFLEFTLLLCCSHGIAHGPNCCRERKEERSTHPHSALNPDAAGVSFDDALDYRQAETCAPPLTLVRLP